jgi:hypothetical protein
MWETKTFRSPEAMKKWLQKNEGRVQWQEVAVNTPPDSSHRRCGVIYRPLRRI